MAAELEHVAAPDRGRGGRGQHGVLVGLRLRPLRGEEPGDSNERDLADLETRGIDGYVSLGREGKAARPRDPEKYPATSRMAEKLSRPAGRAAYAERKWLSEAPNGWIKHVLGFRRFSLRGLAKVQGEWDLVCLALNTKRLHALLAA